MLTSLVLHLRADRQLTAPSNLGRASHALFLRLLAARNPALAESLHAGDGPRPFTCSNLVGGRPRGPARAIAPADALWVRFTGLTAPVSEQLLALAAAPPAAVELDDVVYPVIAATVDPAAHAWAGQIAYSDLITRHLLPAEPRRSLRIEFVSPTSFRSQGMNVPLPLPALVFGSLLGRWQAFAPTAVSDEVARYAEEMVAISQHRLSTRTLEFKEGSKQVGFTGQATFLAMNRDRYWLGILHLLAAYSFYAGVGYQTAVGMGQARPGATN